MFIATAITKQSKLRRSAIEPCQSILYISLLRSSRSFVNHFYRHFIPTGLLLWSMLSRGEALVPKNSTRQCILSRVPFDPFPSSWLFRSDFNLTQSKVSER
jgi:hypothetical protein